MTSASNPSRKVSRKLDDDSGYVYMQPSSFVSGGVRTAQEAEYVNVRGATQTGFFGQTGQNGSSDQGYVEMCASPKRTDMLTETAGFSLPFSEQMATEGSGRILGISDPDYVNLLPQERLAYADAHSLIKRSPLSLNPQSDCMSINSFSSSFLKPPCFGDGAGNTPDFGCPLTDPAFSNSSQDWYVNSVFPDGGLSTASSSLLARRQKGRVFQFDDVSPPEDANAEPGSPTPYSEASAAKTRSRSPSAQISLDGNTFRTVSIECGQCSFLDYNLRHIGDFDDSCFGQGCGGLFLPSEYGPLQCLWCSATLSKVVFVCPLCKLRSRCVLDKGELSEGSNVRQETVGVYSTLVFTAKSSVTNAKS